MIDISGFGARITILAIQSFPVGFVLSQFADDQEPLAIEDIEATGHEMLMDGSIFIFDKAVPVKIMVAVIPGSSDDINLKILLQARKGAASILPLPDITSMVISCPDGGKALFTNGSIIKGPLADTIQQSGRKKGNVYTFIFGSFAGAQSAKQVIAGLAQTFTSLL